MAIGQFLCRLCRLLDCSVAIQKIVTEDRNNGNNQVHICRRTFGRSGGTEEFKREYERIERQSHSNDEKFRWRARKRETSLEKLREEVGLDIPDDAPAIDEQAIDADFIERFTNVLTKPQKEVFKKAYIENKPIRQISREMDMRLSTVQKHISLIQKKFLKKFLQKGGQK